MLSKLIEEAYILHENKEKKSKAAEKWDQTGNTAERIAGVLNAVPVVGGNLSLPAQMYAGYQAGKEVGHPVAGTLLGREAALGAVSKYDPNVSIKDVYTKNNLINKAALSLGALAGLAGTGEVLSDDPTAIFSTPSGEIATGLIATAPIFTPAIGYGAGKLFGSKTPAVQTTPVAQ